MMRFIDLPAHVVIPGEVMGERDYSVRLCGGHDCVVLSVWTSEKKARRFLDRTNLGVPITKVDWKQLVFSLAAEKTCTHALVNPKPTDPHVANEVFWLNELRVESLLAITDFESLWEFAASSVPELGETGLILTKETWKKNPHLHFDDALKRTQKTVARYYSTAELQNTHFEKVRVLWPLAKLALTASGVNEAGLTFVKDMWANSPRLSLEEAVHIGLQHSKRRINPSTCGNSVGCVYILINACMPGIVKIGHTTRDPDERARELSGETGIPTPFTVAYSEEIHDCEEVEREIHGQLARFRVNRGREFFAISVKEAIQIVAEIALRYRHLPQ